MAEEWEREPGKVWDLGGGSRLEVVAAWRGVEGDEVRVARWQVRDAARALYQWARGQAFDAPAPDDEELPWIVGVALEERARPTARWSTIQRQEIAATDPAQVAARLRGWEAGLIDRATRRMRRKIGL